MDSDKPIVVVGPGFFVPLADQFQRSDVPPAFRVPEGVRVEFRPQIAACPGDRAGLHAALDRWLDAAALDQSHDEIRKAIG